MAMPYCRKFSRGASLTCVPPLRSACFFLFLIIAAFLFIYSKNLYTDNEELDFLRAQFDLQTSQIHQLRNELIDANLKVNGLRNSESQCQKTLNEYKDGDMRKKDMFGGFRQHQRIVDEKPRRGDLIPNVQKQPMSGKIHDTKSSDEEYPKLTADGAFIPTRLWVHFDLKGAPLKPPTFISLLPFLKKMGINGILIEWEDMFPYTGRLATAVNGNAYSKEEVEEILERARNLKLEIVPLVQTFGHLEWILKLEEFSHLREDPRYPQVICFGSKESWSLIQDMITQVGELHKRFGMNFFHIGADEVFQLGICNQSIREIKRQGGRDKAIMWHISRTAEFAKEKYSVNVLAWHDMIVQMSERDLKSYNLPDSLEPVLWSYAEDLDSYLPYSNWLSLKPFANVWGSSAFKGADGPMRYSSNPIHYIRNHESWTEQMTRVYREFERFQGLIITGWSRYDHLAVLCELFPVAIPTLAMSAETILAGRPLNGFYEGTNRLLKCSAPQNQGYAYGCQFPGKRLYELVNEFFSHQQQLWKYVQTDFDFNGWLSAVAEKWNSSSPMYIEKVMPYIDFYLQPMERIERELRVEMQKHYHPEVADEFVLTYMSRDLDFLRRRKLAAGAILRQKTFPKRPFVYFPTSQPLSNESEDEDKSVNLAVNSH